MLCKFRNWMWKHELNIGWKQVKLKKEVLWQTVSSNDDTENEKDATAKESKVENESSEEVGFWKYQMIFTV